MLGVRRQTKMIKPDDWRLAIPKEYLRGLVLHHSEWRKPRAEWDHDHCEFCQAKFMEEPSAGVIHDGYTDNDKYHWICPQCFSDFREMFRWSLSPQ
jgi:hypothetical protein